MKIAIVGHGPLTRGLAPFKDPEWTTWGLSLREFQHQEIFGEPRGFDALWEVHTNFPHTPEYQEWFDNNDIRRPDSSILIDSFGPEAFGSSLAWMIAEAVVLNPDEIAIYGCDCSIVDKDEYEGHVPNLKYFLGFAAGRGIKLYAPPQSGLWKTENYDV